MIPKTVLNLTFKTRSSWCLITITTTTFTELKAQIYPSLGILNIYRRTTNSKITERKKLNPIKRWRHNRLATSRWTHGQWRKTNGRRERFTDARRRHRTRNTHQGTPEPLFLKLFLTKSQQMRLVGFAIILRALELYLESLHADLEAIHGLDSPLCGNRVVITYKAWGNKNKSLALKNMQISLNSQ